MNIIGWMLTRMVLIRFVFILFGISIFVITLDIVAYSKEILAIGDGGLQAVFTYVLMRSPGTLSTFLPISVLIAMLLVLIELSYRNELPAIWSSGISPFRIMMMLMPFAIMAGGLHFLLNDQAVPRAAPTLRLWGIGDYDEKKLKVGGESDPIWMRAGRDILRAGSANPQATELDDVIIFRRDEAGLLREQIMAKHAVLNQDRWHLSNVLVYYRENLPPNRLDQMIYSGSFRPAAAGARSGDPEEMSMSDLSYFVENSGFGIRPAWVYQTWWHKRLTLFVTAFAMVALCIPLAARFRRGGGIGVMFAVGIGLGFLFFITDGIALTMGELGFVTPWFAAWAPILGLSAIAGFITFRTERL
ncbi:LptF/LptG family permease [Nordella sp. HKS 07]|uniref:LptF/LptG family permease n=1 Tax=Nordella sp. HKS 07 TaxID=2712222 RepID=UPI0013E0FB74|nr:LptF/LptG family permease [Nordella sp. HKS 07]QIG46535.1 LptF/LptG family permease [Nordella sp. HKS 07]